MKTLKSSYISNLNSKCACKLEIPSIFQAHCSFSTSNAVSHINLAIGQNSTSITEKSNSEEKFNCKMPSKHYINLVQENKIQFDDKQFEIAKRLDEFCFKLIKFQKSSESSHFVANPKNTNLLSNLFSNIFSSIQKSQEKFYNKTPKGYYIHGNSGTGKTFIMDILYDCAPLNAKKRVHFNKFMLDIHNRIFE